MQLNIEDTLRAMIVGKYLKKVEFLDRVFNNKVIGLDHIFELPSGIHKLCNEMNANPLATISLEELEDGEDVFKDSTIVKNA